MNDSFKISNEKDILRISFKPTLKGYDPLQVDTCLDAIYDFVIELRKEIRVLEYKNTELDKLLISSQKRTDELELEVASLQVKLDSPLINSDTTTNIDYIKRIRQLEMKLHQLGVDPKSIK